MTNITTTDITTTDTTTDTTTPTTTPATDVSVTRKPRRERKPKPVTTDATDVATFVPTSIADVFTMARSITGANIDTTVARLNVGHVINAPGKNTGRFTGRRIVAFQNDTLFANVERKLTDVQLLFVWRVEFPSATGRVFVADWKTGVAIVRGVRAELNRNGHGEPHRVPAGFRSESYVSNS